MKSTRSIPIAGLAMILGALCFLAPSSTGASPGRTGSSANFRRGLPAWNVPEKPAYLDYAGHINMVMRLDLDGKNRIEEDPFRFDPDSPADRLMLSSLEKNLPEDFIESNQDGFRQVYLALETDIDPVTKNAAVKFAVRVRKDLVAARKKALSEFEAAVQARREVVEAYATSHPDDTKGVAQAKEELSRAAAFKDLDLAGPFLVFRPLPLPPFDIRWEGGIGGGAPPSGLPRLEDQDTRNQDPGEFDGPPRIITGSDYEKLGVRLAWKYFIENHRSAREMAPMLMARAKSKLPRRGRKGNWLLIVELSEDPDKLNLGPNPPDPYRIEIDLETMDIRSSNFRFSSPYEGPPGSLEGGLDLNDPMDRELYGDHLLVNLSGRIAWARLIDQHPWLSKKERQWFFSVELNAPAEGQAFAEVYFLDKRTEMPEAIVRVGLKDLNVSVVRHPEKESP